MPRFFTEPIEGSEAVLTGEDAAHISRSLRMTVGDMLTLCDGSGKDYICTISAMTAQEVTVHVCSVQFSSSEPDVEVVLFQGLPKGDKMEWIIQKSVELGVTEIVPFIAVRSVSRPDEKAAEKKAERWQKIANEAAKQSQRGKLPTVQPIQSFAQAQKMAQTLDCNILFYEGGGCPIRTVFSEEKPRHIGIWIGPEGGWALSEVENLEKIGSKKVSLGSRILRTETAPLAALTAIMLLTGNLE